MKKTRALLLLPSWALALACGGPAGGEAPQASPEGGAPRERVVSKRAGDDSSHKIVVARENVAALNELRGRGAVLHEVEYEAFVVAEVSDARAGGLERLQALPVELKDDFDLVRIDGYPINARDPEATYAAIEPGLQKSGALAIIQLFGPIKDEWRKQLEQDGFELVSYMAENAYVVRARGGALERAREIMDARDFVQLIGDYEPAFKLAPELRTMASSGALRLTVQVINGSSAPEAIEALRALGTIDAIFEVGPYLDVRLDTGSANLTAIARMDEVFELELYRDPELLDEAQGQILAGALTGNVPSGPGYLAFLAAHGFDSSQFGSFVVEVVDDCTTLHPAHPDLPNARIAFENNPTVQVGIEGGHGFLNSTIVGGFNNGTGATLEDANGYNYGLGIAPWARMGVTAFFGPVFASPLDFEDAAYTGGARISTNSWGFPAVHRYDAWAQAYDFIVRDASDAAGSQALIILFAAGNAGSGANTVQSPATAKNVICVGASENVRLTGTDGCAIPNGGADSANDMIAFSSRGPVNSPQDARIKPDIVAPGTHIESGIPQANYDGSSVCDQFWPLGSTLYGWSSGTSHACPAVAGGAALLYQDFINRGLAAPSPALLKAWLMSSATYMSGTGAGGNLPSNSQGTGRMNLGTTFDGVARMSVDQTTIFGTSGQTFQLTGSVVSPASPFRVTLAWTDAYGPTTGAPFVNNLDLSVVVGGATYRGNVFAGANSTTGGAADTRNNVESVFLPAGTSGNFTITVVATNIAGDAVYDNPDPTDQDFALVIYNASNIPTIGVSPSSLSFNAVLGGANPANQSLSISNTGYGTLAWTGADDQTWLSATPASGTAPSTLTVSANISGLAMGSYNGSVTISGTGATNTPQTVPVSLTVGCGSPADCSDNDACNGAESCQTGVCGPGTPPTIDDGNPCTTDSCDAVTGVAHVPLATGSACSDGDAGNGVETCTASAVCVGFDWGDAPAPYPTLAAANGPSHRIGALVLGAGTSAELDGQPDASAASDSDDGVTFSSPFEQGGLANLSLSVSSAGRLDAWVDFDGDGDFADPGDQIFADQVLLAGANPLLVLVPATARVGTTFARFRVSSTGGLPFDGPALDGEVEDYVRTIDAAQPVSHVVDLASNPNGMSRALYGQQAARGLQNVGMGDVNNDGFADVIAGAHDDTAGRSRNGAFYVYFGGPTFFNGAVTQVGTSQSLRVLGAAARDELGGTTGSQAVVGDVTGDAIPDLIVSAPLVDNGAVLDVGAAYVIPGPVGTGDLDLALVANYRARLLGGAAGDRLGVLGVADLSGDGTLDLILGAPGSDMGAADAGSVYVLRGGGTLVGNIVVSPASAVISVHGVGAGDALGTQASSADFGGGAGNDLLVATPLDDTFADDAGAAYALLDPTPGQYFLGLGAADVRWLGGGIRDHLGSAIASGDVSGSNRADVLLGATGYRDANGPTRTGGAVEIWAGPLLAGTFTLYVDAPAVRLTGPDADSELATALAVIDMTNDGRVELIMAAGLSSGAGNALVQAGEIAVTLGGPTLASHQLVPASELAYIYGENTGARLSRTSRRLAVGDMDGDGRGDFCAGSGGAIVGGGVYGRINCQRSLW